MERRDFIIDGRCTSNSPSSSIFFVTISTPPPPPLITYLSSLPCQSPDTKSSDDGIIMLESAIDGQEEQGHLAHHHRYDLYCIW